MSYELEVQVEQTNALKNQVIMYTAEGKKPSEITRLTGLSARNQREINEEFRQLARGSEYVHKRSKEIIAYGDLHFTSIIERLNEVYEEAQVGGDLKLCSTILGQLAAVERQRIDFLQKAGIINDQGIGAEMARVEAKQAQLIDILKQAKEKFPEASQWIREELMKLNDMTPSTRVDQG